MIVLPVMEPFKSQKRISTPIDVNENLRRMADEFYANHILRQYAEVLKRTFN